VSVFLNKERWIDEASYAVALLDKYPVALGHTLVVPKRVVASIFELTGYELRDCWRLVHRARARLVEEFNPGGFNVGINIGEAAGQTVFHAHIHVIPRYLGDHPSPRGGVRAVIPGKADY